MATFEDCNGLKVESIKDYQYHCTKKEKEDSYRRYIIHDFN